jgi:hypothetical protein
MMGVGLLSDDFPLVERAASADLGAVHAGLFRPVPLAVWSAILSAGGGATTLHALNVILHGTNAYLTRLAAGSRLAGLLLLAAPLAVEAVAWLSGVFDLMATMFVLLAVLTAQRYVRERPTLVRTRVMFGAFGLAALLSKETAAVAGALVLAAALWRLPVRLWPRALVVDAGALLGAAGAFGVWRLAELSGDASWAPDRYALQRGLFNAFGSLAVPWHRSEVIDPSRWIPLVFGLSILLLLSGHLLRREPPAAVRRSVAAIAWVLIPIAPAFPFFFVADDLQGARYLYLPYVGWAALLAWCVPARGAIARAAATFMVAGAIALSAYGTVRHLHPWVEAGEMRERVLAAAAQSGMRQCASVTLTALPDHVRGAYVFRNGAPEAFARELGMVATVAEANGACAFRWDAASASFTP